MNYILFIRADDTVAIENKGHYPNAPYLYRACKMPFQLNPGPLPTTFPMVKYAAAGGFVLRIPRHNVPPSEIAAYISEEHDIPFTAALAILHPLIRQADVFHIYREKVS